MKGLVIRTIPYAAFLLGFTCMATGLAGNWWPLKLTLGVIGAAVLGFFLWVITSMAVEMIWPGTFGNDQGELPPMKLPSNVTPLRRRAR